MSQNFVSLTLTDAQLATVDKALSDIETELGGLISLTTDQRRSMSKMGLKSEVFCRQTLSVLSQNPHVVPASVNVADAQADLLAMDQLRTRITRLTRLSERAVDTGIALGSDVMSAALKGYALLKVTGKNQGLEALRKELGARFVKRSSRAIEPEPEVKAA